MAHHISLQFLGSAQGLHLEAETIPLLARKVRAAIAGCDPAYVAWIEAALADLPAQARRGYAATSRQWGTWSFSWRPEPVEPFAIGLTQRCAVFGPFAGLDYSGQVEER